MGAYPAPYLLGKNLGIFRCIKFILHFGILWYLLHFSFRYIRYSLYFGHLIGSKNLNIKFTVLNCTVLCTLLYYIVPFQLPSNRRTHIRKSSYFYVDNKASIVSLIFSYMFRNI